MIRVLMVLDGDFRYAAGSPTPDFNFSVLPDTLSAAGYQVTKAHRETDPNADIQNFKFDTSVNLLVYDVLWLNGREGRNSTSSTGTSGSGISDTEIRAIGRFMAAGGGVFATGDHDSIGSEMCGHIPRIRAMRSWYGINDSASPMPAGFPRNFASITAARGETTQRNPTSNYGGDSTFVWFENQSDTVPQPIAPMTSPAHPILRRGGNDIVIYPDHMHEGNTFGSVPGYDYTQPLTFAGESFAEFPLVAGNREMPQVIATGQTTPYASKYAATNMFVGSDSSAAGPKTINTLSVYDGRQAGVGRIVSGSTFHHYIDINLTGDSSIDPVNNPASVGRTGPESEKNHGFNDNPARFDDIKAVYVNIVQWLAPPQRALQLILERSTFSQTEATANPNFDGAIVVTVDGLKPNQFPGGGITTLSPSAAQLAGWAPSIPSPATGISVVPTAVASDDPSLSDRLQRFTFTYQVQVSPSAFGFPGNSNTYPVSATLTSPALPAALSDAAWIELTKSANPYMLDLANGNTTVWLSSDVRVFAVAGGSSMFGVTLPLTATRSDALDFLRTLASSVSVGDFESLPMDEQSSALSPLPTTLGGFPFLLPRPVFNFAIARVRLPAAGATADDVRVFFRIFTSQTTAAVTYNESPPGTPIEGYRRTSGASPIALPGSAGNEWLSFPMFSATRSSPPEAQTDPDNVKNGLAPGSSTFFGALIDNNLADPYLPPTPSGSGAVGLSTLLMGEHQCMVAQIEYAGTPIPNGANPFTSDKLAQRNLAFSAIANPGLDASRMALHTFEIEATPNPIVAESPPDELMLDWRREPPDGTEVRLYMPGWNVRDVLDLADRLYPRHDIRRLDDHTVAVPGGGTRYIPVPRGFDRRTGVISAHLPLGVRKGQRFDVSVRQVTTRWRYVDAGRPKETRISRQEAGRLLERVADAETIRRTKQPGDDVPRGVFDLGDNKILITDLRVVDGQGDHALIVEHPDPKLVESARKQSGRWRQIIGGFQLAIPVSVKSEMLTYYLRLLSLLRWRAEALRPSNRWYATFMRYVELMAEKVRALGGDPWSVPATPDGNVGLPGDGGQPSGEGSGPSPSAGDADPFFEPGSDDWLGDTDGLLPPDVAKASVWSGKVSGLLFDHFGDFEGFTLEAFSGAQHRFFSREHAILELARSAWRERYVVTVATVSAHSRRVRRLLIRGYAP
jgi:hypothetical protein